MIDDEDQIPDPAGKQKDQTDDAAAETAEEIADDILKDGSDDNVWIIPDIGDTGDAAGEAGEDATLTYEELQASVAELKDHLLRALADTENTRRRAEREKTDTAKYAATNMARAVLGVADNLSRALATVSEEAKEADEELKNLCVGIELTETEMVNAFEQFGIVPIEAMGRKFDHNFHQAMFEIEDPDLPAGTVVQEVQRGYVIHDRLLRPAMVGVSKGGPKASAPTDAPADAPAETPAAAATDPGAEASPESEDSNPSPASAYEKQSDAADREADGAEPQIDRKL